MSQINLLPWREEMRERRSKQLVAGTIGLWLLAGLIVLGSYQVMELLKDNQNARNAFLRAEIDALEDEIKEIEALKERRDRLISRMEVIQDLQQNRTELVRIVDDLVRLMPEGVYLTHINRRDKAMIIEGRAQSNARVSALMENLDASEWFHGPTLDVINVIDDPSGRVSAFTLQVERAGEPPADPNQQSG